jgi:MOSC domain-containing protein YiiM
VAGKNGETLLARWVAQTGYTGVYLRVLSEGVVAVSNALECIGRCRDPISLAHVNDVICERTHDPALNERPANLPEFTAGGHAPFAWRLERMKRDDRTGRPVRAGEDVSWV